MLSPEWPILMQLSSRVGWQRDTFEGLDEGGKGRAGGQVERDAGGGGADTAKGKSSGGRAGGGERYGRK